MTIASMLLLYLTMTIPSCLSPQVCLFRSQFILTSILAYFHCRRHRMLSRFCPPPDAPEPFTNNVFGECVNFTWSHQNSDILDFTISVLSLPRVIVDGSLRAHSICGTFSRNIIYIVGISCRSRSGVSHEVYTEVRYYLQPRLVFSSAPIPSIGLAPSDPPLEALIYDFPTGASLTGFVVYFSSDEDPLVNRLLAFVNGTVLPENPYAPLQVYFRTPVFPDFCMPSGECRSYKVSVCFESSLSKVCTHLKKTP